MADPEERAGLPRWLKLALIVGVLVAVLVLVMLLTGVLGDGGHQPRRHGEPALEVGARGTGDTAL